MASSRCLDRALFGAGFALLLAVSWPGVEARADSDLAPSARDLTSLNAAPAAAQPRSAAGASCDATAPLVDPRSASDQRAAMQRLAQLVQGGNLKPMNGRGHSYAAPTDPMLELMRVQLEARSAKPQE